MKPNDPSDGPRRAGTGRLRVDGGRIGGYRLVTKRNVLRLLILLLILIPIVDYLWSL